MPWTGKQAQKKYPDFSLAEAEQWAKIATAYLESCLKNNGKQQDCEGRAIKIANGVIKNQRDHKTGLRMHEGVEDKYKKIALSETAYFGVDKKVDRENGVISGIVLLGEVSKNGLEYSEAARRGAAKTFEGFQVFFDHDAKATDGFGKINRNVQELAGVIQNTSFSETLQRPIGDLKLLCSGDSRELLLNTAEFSPHALGMSVNTSGKCRIDEKGNKIVEEIYSVKNDGVHRGSVDVVTDPATTAGLFENVMIRESETKKGEHKKMDINLAEATHEQIRQFKPDFVRNLTEPLDNEIKQLKIENEKLTETVKRTADEKEILKLIEINLEKIPEKHRTDQFRKKLLKIGTEAGMAVLTEMVLENITKNDYNIVTCAEGSYSNKSDQFKTVLDDATILGRFNDQF